jgi:hypothetical protein
MASFHDLRVGETLCLRGVGEVRVTLRAKSGRRARLEIVADNGVIIRPEDTREDEPDGPLPGTGPLIGTGTAPVFHPRNGIYPWHP